MNESPVRVCSNCGSPLPVAAPGSVERCKFCGAETREPEAVKPFDAAALNARPKPTLAIIAGLVGALLVALVIIVTMRNSPGHAARAARVPFDLVIDGERVTVRPAHDGYEIEKDGLTRDRVKVEGDRVKVEDTSGKQVAEAKRKDYGFKIYDASSTVVMEGKRDGSGWKIKRPSGEIVVKLTSPAPDAIATVSQLSTEERVAAIVLLREGGS